MPITLHLNTVAVNFNSWLCFLFGLLYVYIFSPLVLVIMLQIPFDSFLFFLTCHQMSEQSARCCRLLIQNRRANLGNFSLNARWG